MLAFFVIIGRFVFIAQGKEVAGHKLIQLGQKQWTQYKLIDEKRGTIFSNDGQILAEDVPSYTLYAVLSPSAGKDFNGQYRYVRDKQKTARELAPILKMPESTILAKLNTSLYQVEFGSNGHMLSVATKARIDRLKLPGINYFTESKRYYPSQSSAAYTIGFTQNNPATNTQTGVFGVEQSLNRYLTEKDGSIRYYRSTGGVPIPDETQKITKAVPGDNVTLTLNSRIQTVLDQAMTNVNKTYKPNSMIGIVADPKTGKILAMSTYPDFNLNKRDITQYSNIAIASPFEPGSVMKTFTVASAIDAGVFKGNATYKSGSYQTQGGVIHDWDLAGWGMINFNQAFELSSNVGMSVLTDKYLGTNRFESYLRKFGFMKTTGIDLPGEQPGIVNWNWPIDKLEASFGQASAFTAMQIVQASTAIANNGVMMRPYVVDKVVNPQTGKTVLNNQPYVAGRPISAAAASETRALMRQVVSNKNVVNGFSATGLAYDLPGYDVIGKTGTAQIASKGQYLVGKNNYVFSFLGMAPEKDPKMIVYVAVKQPHLKPTDLGSEPVVAIVRPVMTSTLQYFQVNKKLTGGGGQLAQPSVKMADYTGRPVNEAAQTLQSLGLNPVQLGTGTVSAQLPVPGEQLMIGNRVILRGEGQTMLPNLSGWTLGDTMKLSQILGLHLTVSGSGYATSQNPSAGTVITKGSALHVTLSPPGTKQTQTGTAKQ
jgi:Cell division protein FtsI/penicillin-binding protein 2